MNDFLPEDISVWLTWVFRIGIGCCLLIGCCIGSFLTALVMSMF